MQTINTIVRILVYILVGDVVLLLFFSHFCNEYIVRYSRDFIFTSPNTVPYRPVALVLGTSKYVQGGDSNPYFVYRMSAAAQLYQAGKVEFILASGDNSKKWYNEPLKMKEDLLLAGIPGEKIHLDYAGFRTLDSIIRAERIFGLHDFIIISQHFHIQRAVFIARALGLKAVGYTASDVEGRQNLKIRVREYFAKVKAFMDIFIFDTQPKFLGEKIDIY